MTAQEHKPLQFSYDLERDVLTVEGKQYSGHLFRVWGTPPTGLFYQFKVKDEAILVEQVVPCAACRKRFFHTEVL